MCRSRRKESGKVESRRREECENVFSDTAIFV